MVELLKWRAGVKIREGVKRIDDIFAKKSCNFLMMVDIQSSLACDIDLIDYAFAVDFNPE